MFAHLGAVRLDRVMDREEVARHIVDSAAAIHPIHRAQPYLSQAERTFHRLPN
jgi:hypothetical protein